MTVTTIQVPTGPQVFTISVPGVQGPPGLLRIVGTVTGAPGTSASVSSVLAGDGFNELTFTIPRGDVGAGSPTGGTIGQVLTKNSNTNFDTIWVSATDLATVSTFVKRDASGNSAFNKVFVAATPSAANEATRKDYVDAIGVSTATVSTVARRDINADIAFNQVTASAATPTAVGHLTRKDYVDTGLTGKAAAVHTHVATDISNSSTIGRTVLTAADGPAIRTAIGAGTSSLALGTSNTTAKAGDYQPTAANISDATTIGRTILTAVDAAAVRTATGAGTSSLVIGTTSTTAKAGDYAPPADGAAGVATTRTLGTGATQAAAGNHTHTSTGITDFVEATQDVVGAALVSGANVNVVYDDATGLTTISSTASGVSFATLPAGTTITVLKAGGVWPARPTSRTDIVVAWKGADPDPTIITTGTGGMMDNVDYRLVTP